MITGGYILAILDQFCFIFSFENETEVGGYKFQPPTPLRLSLSLVENYPTLHVCVKVSNYGVKMYNGTQFLSIY